MNLYEPTSLPKPGQLRFLDQLKLQALRRYEDENRLYDATLDDHILALESVVANTSDGIVLVEGGIRAGLELRVQYVNRALTELTGYTAEDLLGKSLRALFASSADSDFEETIEQKFLHAESGEMQVECVRRDRTTFHATIRFSPVTDGRGRLGKWFFQIRDITGQINDAELLKKLQSLETENEHLKSELNRTQTLEAELRLHAIHDPVTGLCNRSYFMERVAEALRHADGSYIGSVLYLSFDNFEKAHKEIGRHAAECVLIEVTRRLRAAGPAYHTIAHLDNAEFALLLHGKDARSDFEAMTKLLDTLSQRMEILDRSIFLQPAMGLCPLNTPCDSPAQIVRNAYTAMCRASRQTGSGGLWYENAMNVHAASLTKARHEMREAIDNEEIVVNYQPQLDVQTSPPRLCAVEAFARWNHRSQGVLLPERFFPQAEKHSLMVPLELHVIRTACNQLKTWQSNVLFPDVALTLNISATMLSDPDLFANFVDILAETEIDAHAIHLDIPASIFLQSADSAVETVRRIRMLGVRIILDNWGKESSSVLTLDKLPIDAVKIDRSLVESLEHSKAKAELARLLVTYAKSMGVAPTASGVANIAEKEILQSLGCTVLQGNMFSKAGSIESITTLLEQGTRSLMHAGEASSRKEPLCKEPQYAPS